MCLWRTGPFLLSASVHILCIAVFAQVLSGIVRANIVLIRHQARG
jgi:hypothetical protein